jgi:hypothetical protein
MGRYAFLVYASKYKDLLVCAKFSGAEVRGKQPASWSLFESQKAAGASEAGCAANVEGR